MYLIIERQLKDGDIKRMKTQAKDWEKIPAKKPIPGKGWLSKNIQRILKTQE